MRIVIANQFGSVVGGAETYAFSIAKALAENGHRVAIAVAESPGNAGNHFNISGVECLGRHESPGSWVNAISAFAPDVVYSQVLADPRIDEALGARWPLVMFNHNHSGACISGTKRFLFPSVAICNRSLGMRLLFIRAIGTRARYSLGNNKDRLSKVL